MPDSNSTVHDPPQSGHTRRWVHYDRGLGHLLVIVGVVFFLVSMLVPYCDVLMIPTLGLTTLGVAFCIPESRHE